MTINSRHIVIPEIMQIRVLSPRTALVPWWLSGGIGAANCLVAYTPKGAASQAASYDNNAAPGNGLADGTYDAALVGAAPAWASTTGWTWTAYGAVRGINCGALAAVGMTVIARFSDAGGGTYPWLFWESTSTFYVQPMANWSFVTYRSGNVVSVAPGLDSGTLAIAGTKGYRNGVAEATLNGALTPGNPINIGVKSIDSIRIYAIAIYTVPLTATQVLAVHTAMIAL